MTAPECISPPADGTAFASWEFEFSLARPRTPQLLFKYEREPPHGDFLYTVTLGGRPLRAGTSKRLVWGRTLAVCPCGGFVACTDYVPGSSGWRVGLVILDIGSELQARTDTFVAIHRLSEHSVQYVRQDTREQEEWPLDKFTWSPIWP